LRTCIVKKILALSLVLFSVIFPAYAQDETCEIDLIEVNTYLAEAQNALDNDDYSAALAAVTDARTSLENIENACLETISTCTINSVAYCVEIADITFSNGEILKPGDVLNIGMGEALQVQSVTYSITNENLEVIRSAHGRASYAYAYAFPVIGKVDREDLSQASGAVDPLATTESHTLTITDQTEDWVVQNDWGYLVILIMHYSPAEEREESPVARVRINLNIRSQ
jgi:hypothetical protein